MYTWLCSTLRDRSGGKRGIIGELRPIRMIPRRRKNSMTNPLLLFALPADLQLEDLLIESETLTLLLSSSQSHQACPDCAHPSSRVHSRYRRRLADLPCQRRAVELYLKVRRFFCENPACSRRTFAESFPDLAPAYARRTLRQGKTLGEIAFALGGRAGARLVLQW